LRQRLSLHVEKKGVCRHVSSPTLNSVSERGGYVRNVVKVKCTLRVIINHPYIGVENANGSREVWGHLRRPLMMMLAVDIRV